MRQPALAGMVVVMMLLSLFGVGYWQFITPPVALLIVPGASQVHIVAPFRGQQKISYEIVDITWGTVLDERLRERGWRGPDPANPYDPTNYYRSYRIGFVSLNEMIAVRGSRTHAEITLYRHVTVLGQRIL
jgi:hypothetical protein